MAATKTAVSLMKIKTCLLIYCLPKVSLFLYKSYKSEATSIKLALVSVNGYL